VKGSRVTPDQRSTGRGNTPPADHSILLFGCLGAAVTFATVACTATVAHTARFWSVFGTVSSLLLMLVALYCWRVVRRDGFFEQASDDEDEDGNPEGGSKVRFPPDAPDGGGSLEFDWQGFLAGFRDYVEASSSEPVRELARQ
jgi:hypothetical protein